MIRAMLPLLLGFALCHGCSNGSLIHNGLPIRFVVPVGMKGPIRLILDESTGIEVIPANGEYVYRIPATGVVRIRSFRPFQDKHTQTAEYENGTVIPQEYETWITPFGGKPTVSKAAAVFQGGGITQQNDGPNTMIFFIGTVAEYAKWQQEQDARLRAETEKRGVSH